MSYERAAELAGRASYTSAGGTLLAGLTLNELAALVGIAATIVTTALHWYYQAKRDAREERAARERFGIDEV